MFRVLLSLAEDINLYVQEDIHLYIQEVKWTPSKLNSKPRHSIIKLLKPTKERSLKQPERNNTLLLG